MQKLEFILNLIVNNTERLIRVLSTLFCLYLAYNWIFQSETAASLLLLGVIVFFVYPITYCILAIVMVFVEFIAGIVLSIIEYIEFDKHHKNGSDYDNSRRYNSDNYHYQNQRDEEREYHYSDDSNRNNNSDAKLEFHNALKFYGLTIPFSEKELRERRKFLMKKYHPDAGGSDDDAKKINKYFDLLKKFASSDT